MKFFLESFLRRIFYCGKLFGKLVVMIGIFGKSIGIGKFGLKDFGDDCFLRDSFLNFFI